MSTSDNHPIPNINDFKLPSQLFPKEEEKFSKLQDFNREQLDFLTNFVEERQNLSVILSPPSISEFPIGYQREVNRIRGGNTLLPVIEKPPPINRKNNHLILDLDNTLLHAIEYNGENAKELPKDVSILTLPTQGQFLLKLRPFLKSFLLELSELYELYIYTNGSREYLDGIIQVLSELVGGKVAFAKTISRSDFKYDETQKDLFTNHLMKDLCHLNEDIGTNIHRTIIFDDRRNVWANSEYSSAFILAEPYSFLDTKENVDYDKHLLYMTKTLSNIAILMNNSSSIYDRETKYDATGAIENVRSNVLKGLVIDISGHPDPTSTFEVCKQFGAVIFRDDPEKLKRPTHLIGYRNNTRKIYDAQRTSDIFVVHWMWLWHCFASWEKCSEEAFFIDNFKHDPESGKCIEMKMDHWKIGSEC